MLWTPIEEKRFLLFQKSGCRCSRLQQLSRRNPSMNMFLARGPKTIKFENSRSTINPNRQTKRTKTWVPLERPFQLDRSKFCISPIVFMLNMKLFVHKRQWRGADKGGKVSVEQKYRFSQQAKGTTHGCFCYFPPTYNGGGKSWSVMRFFFTNFAKSPSSPSFTWLF